MWKFDYAVFRISKDVNSYLIRRFNSKKAAEVFRKELQDKEKDSKTVYIVIKILRENKRRKEILERGLR